MAFELRSVESKDGTQINYCKLGSGPGIIFVHGAMQSGSSHSELATSLSKNFTCYLPDRRGRGKSGPSGNDYCLAKEVEDLESIRRETGAEYLFGVSSGAFIVMKTALAFPDRFKRIAIFEPPWFSEAEREENTAWLARYEEEIEKSDIAGALTTAMLGAKMGPPVFQYVPRPILHLLTNFAMKAEESARKKRQRQPSSEEEDLGEPPTFKELAPTLKTDCKIVFEMLGEENLQPLSAIKTQTLILGGNKSPAYLKRSVRELEKILPNAERVELQGANHGATNNRKQRGNPEIVAAELRQWFLAARCNDKARE